MNKSQRVIVTGYNDILETMDITADSNFKSELRNMILTADKSVHNISKYNMSYTKMYLLWQDLIQGECLIEYKAYGILTLNTTQDGSIVKTLQLNGVDDDYFPRLDKFRKTIATILLGIDSNMTEVEKALYVHDYIIENTVYKTDKSFCFRASGPLAYGYGVCYGYTAAFNFMMTLLNIQTSTISSTPLNHSWSYVYLDDSWYHVDVTWDDTLSTSKNQSLHTFFIRNDKEFNNSAVKKHYDWFNPTEIESTSGKYTNLFVHDVVGKLYYQSGYWYYYKPDINSVVRNRIDGSEYKIMLDGSKFLSKIGIDLVDNRKIVCIVDDQKIILNI